MESMVPVRVSRVPSTVTVAAWPTEKAAASTAWKGTVSFM